CRRTARLRAAWKGVGEAWMKSARDWLVLLCNVNSPCSERGRAVEYHALTGLRMVDLQPRGMQGQSRAGVECLFMGVEPVAQQRMADAEHVHAQLVGASGYGGQLHPAVIAKAFQD